MAKALDERGAIGAARPLPSSLLLGMTGLALSILLSALGTSIANVGLPVIAEAFDAPFQAVQWVVIAYLLASTSAVVAAGRLGDLIGRKRLLLAGVASFVVASAVCGLAPSLWVLIGGRAVQGLAAAIMMALSMAIVSETVSKESAGRAMGLLGTMSAIGTALGPTLGGILISALGWPAIFLIQVPLGMLAFALIHHAMPAGTRTAAPEGRFDALGTFVLVMTLSLYALAMTVGGEYITLLLVGAIVGATFFVWIETRVAAPLLRPAILSARGLGAALAMSALISTIVMASLVVGPFYLSGTLRLDAAVVGLVMSVGPLIAAASGVPAGQLVDRFGTRRITLAGLAALTIGALALALLPESFGVVGYLIPLALVTAGYAVFQTANNTAVMALAPAAQRGVHSGLLNLSRNLGLITGASAMGAVFAFGSGASDVARASPQALAFGMQLTFAVATSLGCLALVIAGLSGRGKAG